MPGKKKAKSNGEDKQALIREALIGAIKRGADKQVRYTQRLAGLNAEMNAEIQIIARQFLTTLDPKDAVRLVDDVDHGMEGHDLVDSVAIALSEIKV